MNKYFSVKLEFDKQRIDRTIENAINNKDKGYICAIESNNLTVANKNRAFNKVVNDSLINICDGSVLALLLGKIHKQKFYSFTGNDLFIQYINKRKYRHYFLGNTAQVLFGLKANLEEIDPEIKNMTFTELPFKKIEDFDYQTIAENINQDNPDIIWVSLGAPKQEFFMSNLLPYLNRGIMVGLGAAFNFNAGVGHVRRAPSWMREFKLEWLYRAVEEPKKNIPRYWNFIKILPSLILKEKQHIKHQKGHLQ
ncbi:WecB/TagA/CpsF family glycosyltransferase [Viscerimonas tarda]